MREPAPGTYWELVEVPLGEEILCEVWVESTGEEPEAELVLKARAKLEQTMMTEAK